MWLQQHYDTNNNNMTESDWSPNDTELAMVWRAVGCVMESEARLDPRMFSELVINAAGDPIPLDQVIFNLSYLS